MVACPTCNRRGSLCAKCGFCVDHCKCPAAALAAIYRPEDLLTPEQQQRLDHDLAEMARTRRKALAKAHTIYLP